MQEEITLPEGIKLCAEHAVYCREDEALAIADLHLGYEASLQAEAVAMPDFQFEIMTGRLERLLKKYTPQTLIINGDIKHEFGRNMGQEWDEVSQMIRLAAEHDAELVMVRGNHDNFLKTIVARQGVEVVDFLDVFWGAYHWPAFNLADAAITVGTFWVAIGLIWRPSSADGTD